MTFPASLYANSRDYSRETRSIVEDHATNKFRDSYLYSVWGQGWDLYDQDGDSKGDGDTKKKSVKSFYLKEKKLYYLENLRSNKSDLIIFFPGVFTNLKDRMNRRMIKTYLKQGLHVIAFSNPLSRDFVKQGPKYAPGNPIKEAKLLRQSISKIIRGLKRKKLVNKVHLIGVSYGAFLGSILAAQDSFKLLPLITGNITLISPPFHLLKSLKRLDHLTTKTHKEYAHSSYITVYKQTVPILRLKNQREVLKEHKKNSRGLIAHFAFKYHFVKSLKEFQKVDRRFRVPRRKKEYRVWYKRLSFMGYYKNYFPNLYRTLKGKKGSINYWMNLYYRRSGKIMRILASNDDFLNSPGVWRNFKKRQALITKHGGHYGFRKEQWFHDFLLSIL